MATTQTSASTAVTQQAPAAEANWIGWAFALASTASFSAAPTLARAVIAAGLDPTAVLFARMGIATALLALTMALTSPQRLIASRRCFQIAMGAGFLNGLGMLSFFWSLSRLQASMASMLLAVSPLFVLTLLALRGEKVTYRHAVRLALALSGVYLLVGPGGHVDFIGVLLALTAVLIFAIQLVTIQWFLLQYDSRTVTLYVLVAMTVTITVRWIWQGMIWRDPGLHGWLAIVVLAFVSTYLARQFLFAGVSRIGGGQMALLSPVETLLTILWSTLFLHERLAPLQWIGGALILTSAALAVRRLGRARWRPRWRVWTRT